MKKTVAIVTILVIAVSLSSLPSSVSGIDNQTKITPNTWVLHDFYSHNLTSIINGTKQESFAGLNIADISPYQLKLNITDVFHKLVEKPSSVNVTRRVGENDTTTLLTNTKNVPHVNASFYNGIENIYDATINTESWESQILGGPSLTYLNWQNGGTLVAAIGEESIDSAFGIPLPDDFTVVQLFTFNTPVPEAGDFSEPFVPVTSIKNVQRALIDTLDFNDQETLNSKSNKILNLSNPYFSSPHPFFIHNNLSQIRDVIEDGNEFVNESGYVNTFQDSSLVKALLSITKNSVEFTTTELEGKFEIVFKSEFEYTFNKTNIFNKNKLGDSENPTYSYFYKYTLIGNTNTGILEHYSTDQIVNTTLGGGDDGTVLASRYDRTAFAFNNSLTTPPSFPTSSTSTTNTSLGISLPFIGAVDDFTFWIILGATGAVVIAVIATIFIILKKRK